MIVMLIIRKKDLLEFGGEHLIKMVYLTLNK